MITYEIKQSQLNELLKRTDKGKFQSAIDMALKRIGDAMEGAAKRIAPYKTGNLRRSITSTQSRKSVTTGTDLIYAAIQEFGGLAGKNKSAKIPAHPYLRPALAEQKAGKAIDIITEEIKRILK